MDKGGSQDAGLVVFVHIPKTAGTTLTTILAHQYSTGGFHKVMMRGMSLVSKPGISFLARPNLSFSKVRRLKLALKHDPDLRVIHGHFDLSLGNLLPADARFFTVLRDPIERAISHYYHYRRLATDPIHPLAMRSTLSEWVEGCGLVEMDNGQTRRLAGEMEVPCGRVTREMLDRAKANLARFAFIGLTERFEESQILLHREFGWPLRRYRARNVGENLPQRAEIGHEVLETIERCNRFDLELYRYAAALFERAIARIDMATALALLRSAPEHIEPRSMAAA